MAGDPLTMRGTETSRGAALAALPLWLSVLSRSHVPLLRTECAQWGDGFRGRLSEDCAGLRLTEESSRAQSGLRRTEKDCVRDQKGPLVNKYPKCPAPGEHIGVPLAEPVQIDRLHRAGYSTITAGAFAGLAEVGVEPRQFRDLPAWVKQSADPAAALLAGCANE